MRHASLATLMAVGFAVPAAASEGGKHLFIPDAVWLPVNLAAFLFLLYWFVGRPLGRFLDSRRDTIGADLKEAQNKLAQAEELRAQVVERLEAVEGELSELKERAQREGEAEAERIEEESRGEEERFLRKIEEEISRRHLETRNTLARETVVLTTELARELLERQIGDEDRQRILERSLAAMQALQEKE